MGGKICYRFISVVRYIVKKEMFEGQALLCRKANKLVQVLPWWTGRVAANMNDSCFQLVK